MTTIEKAIKHFEHEKNSAVAVLDRGFGTKANECNIVYKYRKLYAELAINALEKQIPKRPVIKYHKEDVTPVKYGRLMEFHCPNCDRLVAAMYETDHKRGGGIHRSLKGCCTCLQAIDFGEYYYMSNLDDEIELE